MANEDIPAEGTINLGNFSANIGRLVREIDRQGADWRTWLDQQAMCTVEEAGEFIGAYRRWRGFARRAGTSEDVQAELADCIISAAVMLVLFDMETRFVPGFSGSDPEAIDRAVGEKLTKIFSRGWVNKTPEYPPGAPDISQIHGVKPDHQCNRHGVNFSCTICWGQPGDIGCWPPVGDQHHERRSAYDENAVNSGRYPARTYPPMIGYAAEVGDIDTEPDEVEQQPNVGIWNTDIEPGHNLD